MAPRACAVAARCTREKALSVGTYIECCVVHGRNRRMLSFVGTRSTGTFMEGMKSLPLFLTVPSTTSQLPLKQTLSGLNDMWPVGQGDREQSFFTASLKRIVIRAGNMLYLNSRAALAERQVTTRSQGALEHSG